MYTALRPHLPRCTPILQHLAILALLASYLARPISSTPVHLSSHGPQLPDRTMNLMKRQVVGQIGFDGGDVTDMNQTLRAAYSAMHPNTSWCLLIKEGPTAVRTDMLARNHNYIQIRHKVTDEESRICGQGLHDNLGAGCGGGILTFWSPDADACGLRDDYDVMFGFDFEDWDQMVSCVQDSIRKAEQKNLTCTLIE
ncbi:MAG: hypothetical protein M1838_001256 [Thelocarpon superellum]|nr:MAG: hypothetical protein M1838_001256 [Thelocarpon superellum]